MPLLPPALAVFRRLLLYAALLAAAGCRPDPVQGRTTAAGQVVDASTGQPVAYAEVGVWRVDLGGGLGGGGGYTALGPPCQADAQGRFALSFEAAAKAAYTLRAVRAPGYVTNWGTTVDVTSGRANDGLRVPAQAPAWLRFLLVDEGPKSRVALDVYGYDGHGFQLRFAADTAFVRPVGSNAAATVVWTLTDAQGAVTRHERAVFVPSLDTLTVRIPF